MLNDYFMGSLWEPQSSKTKLTKGNRTILLPRGTKIRKMTVVFAFLKGGHKNLLIAIST